MLVYYMSRKHLPEKLDELQPFSFSGKLDFTCPISGERYIYDRQGVKVTGEPGMGIFYDPKPSHSGFRWTIVEQMQDSGALIADVKAIPETHFPHALPVEGQLPLPNP